MLQMVRRSNMIAAWLSVRGSAFLDICFNVYWSAASAELSRVELLSRGNSDMDSVAYSPWDFVNSRYFLPFTLTLKGQRRPQSPFTSLAWICSQL